MNELFHPVRIGRLGLKNRAVMPAMGTGYATEKGEVSERLLAYLKRRAEGGVGLIVTEVCAVHPLGRGFPGELGLYDDSFLRGMDYLARTVKGAGAAVAAQLHHAGRETFPQVIGETPVAPTAIPSRALGVTPRELTREEIAELVNCFARAAVGPATPGSTRWRCTGPTVTWSTSSSPPIPTSAGTNTACPRWGGSASRRRS